MTAPFIVVNRGGCRCTVVHRQDSDGICSRKGHRADCLKTCEFCSFHDCTHCEGCGACFGSPHDFDCAPPDAEGSSSVVSEKTQGGGS